MCPPSELGAEVPAGSLKRLGARGNRRFSRLRSVYISPLNTPQESTYSSNQWPTSSCTILSQLSIPRGSNACLSYIFESALVDVEDEMEE